MAYIGRIPQVGNYFTLDAITASSTATYNLLKGGVAYVPETAYHLIVSLNGVIQAPITAYTVSGSQIIFDSALSGTDSIDFITVLGDTLAIGTPSDGTVTNAKIVDMAATKLTGSIADARVPASAVTQHVTGYDDSAIRADISALALREATNEASAAFNLPNSFIDTFATDVLATKTDVAVTSGYVASVIPAYGFNSNTEILLHMDDTNLSDSSGNSITTSLAGNTTRSSTQSKFGSYSAYFDGTGDILTFGNVPKFNGSGQLWGLDFWWHPTGGLTGSGRQAFFAGTDDSEWVGFSYDQGNQKLLLEVANSSGTWQSLGSPTGTKNNFATGNWYHIAIARTSDTNISWYVDGVLDKSVTIASGVIRCNSEPRISEWGGNQSWYITGYIDEFRYQLGENPFATSGDPLYIASSTFTPPTKAYSDTTTSATGTAIQATNTVGSAKTEVSGTIIYKDNAGTATLGTDLKIYFTCNGGSNWTEAASYNAITPVYATGIKQVRLGKTTCTSGTDVRYKAVWANQASGSKETQLHGISINY